MIVIVFNCTGLRRTYWIPRFAGQWTDRYLWYGSVKFLCLELTIQSRDMGAMFVRKLNAWVKVAMTEAQPS